MLTDRFERDVTYLRVSVTDRCNYRCVYCMPAAGVTYQPHATLLTYEEIETIVRALSSVGVRRVRLTGGEPLVRRDLPSLISRLAAIDGIDEVLLSTNAHLLDRFATSLAEAGVAGLNVSLDTLQADRFERLTRGGSLARVLAGLDAARTAGIQNIKVNAVVVGGFNEDELLDLVAFSIRNDFVLRFIEFMPIGDTVWTGGRCVPATQIRARIAERYELVPEGPRAGKGPARYWRLFGEDTQSWGHPVGIISAVTECFCSDCNRIRLTAQGGLRACLADDREVNLRDVLRQGANADDLVLIVQNALANKRESHTFDIEGQQVTSKAMVRIGG